MISLERWAAELLRVYSDERLPILLDEEKWKDWADVVAGTGIFKRHTIPSATGIKSDEKVDSFKDWEEWAMAVYIKIIKIREE